jgi:hypothetical protein
MEQHGLGKVWRIPQFRFRSEGTGSSLRYHKDGGACLSNVWLILEECIAIFAVWSQLSLGMAQLGCGEGSGECSIAHFGYIVAQRDVTKLKRCCPVMSRLRRS